MRIAWNLLRDANHRNSLQVFRNVEGIVWFGPDEYGVSYTIAFHVAVYDETQRLAWRTQK